MRVVNSIDDIVNSVFDKQSGQLTFMKRPAERVRGFQNKNGPAFWPRYISTKDEIVSFVSAEDVLNGIEQVTNPSEPMKAIAAELASDSNPIVIVAPMNKHY